MGPMLATAARRSSSAPLGPARSSSAARSGKRPSADPDAHPHAQLSTASFAPKNMWHDPATRWIPSTPAPMLRWIADAVPLFRERDSGAGGSPALFRRYFLQYSDTLADLLIYIIENMQINHVGTTLASRRGAVQRIRLGRHRQGRTEDPVL